MILRPYTVTVLRHPKKIPVSGLLDGKTELVFGPEVVLARNPATAIAKIVRQLPSTPPVDIDELSFQVMEMGETVSEVGGNGGLDF